ncbi:MAG: IMPACT family protein [Aminivibrio sp.]
MIDGYFEPDREVEIETKIRKSVFIGHVRICETENCAREKLKEIVSKHKQATHNCWGYRVGVQNREEYCSDDGEPSGTAGKPILGAILRNDITNALIVVTRYYGGIKLGVRGLIEAYGNSAEDGIREAGRRFKRVRNTYNIALPYDMIGNAERLLQSSETGPEFQFNYGESVNLICRVPAVNSALFENTLDEWTLTGKIRGWKKTDTTG